jgi:hypothetical protein
MAMRLIACALLTLCLTLCASAFAAPDPPPGGPAQSPASQTTGQRIYCERSYSNFAKGFRHYGIYVDPSGDVYSYEYQSGDKVWLPKQPHAPTEQELEEKYGHGRRLVRKVDPRELREKYRLVEPASRGRPSKGVQGGYDMGETVSRCYLLDAATGRYREVELKVAGDWSYENLSPSARALTKWLESIEAPEGRK